jgi:hypothetical protein
MDGFAIVWRSHLPKKSLWDFQDSRDTIFQMLQVLNISKPLAGIWLSAVSEFAENHNWECK